MNQDSEDGAEDIKREFMAELTELLKRYDAELSAKDHYQGYAECGEDVRMTVSIPSKWDKDGELVRVGCEINLGGTSLGWR